MERFAAWIALGLLAVFLLVVGLRDGGEETTTTVRSEAGTTTPPTIAAATTTAATPTTSSTGPATSITVTTEPGIRPAALPLEVAHPSEWYSTIVAVSEHEAWVVLVTDDSAGLMGHLADGEWTHHLLSEDDARVLGMAGAPDGTVWAATDVGVFAFDGEDWERRFDGPVGGIAVAPDGTVWIGGLRASDPWAQDRVWLARWDAPGWQRVGPNPDDVPVPSGVTDLAALPGETWMIHRAGGWIEDDVVRYDGAAWEIVEVAGIPDATPDNGMPAVGAFAVEAAPDGDVWVAGYLAAAPREIVLARFDGSDWTRYDWPYSEPAGAASHFAVAAGPDGVIWFAFEGGLASFDGSAWTRFREGETLYGVAVAPDGAVWFTDHEGAHSLDVP
jgi:hypothetical protein